MILCCGEALIDMLPRLTAAGEAAFVPCPGGGVFNTAVALGRMGATAGLLAGLSTDPLGAILVRGLDAAGVDHRLCPRSARPTTLAFVTLEEGQARYAFHDENSAGRMLTPADLPALPASVRALFFGGISLVSPPAADAYAALMAREAGAGPGARVTMLDPNIRPGFVTDEAAYRARLAGMLARADIVKVSDEDLHWLEGAGETAALARGLLARGPALVLVTEGARGARAFTARGERAAPARQVAVADAVGAGDTFTAGVLAALDRAGALDRAAIAALPDAVVDAALDLGIRAAAVTVSRPGADPPWAHEL